MKITLLQLRRMDIEMTQTAVGNAAGVNSTVICMFEKMQRKPWPAVRRRLAAVLGVREDVLFTKDGWPVSFEKLVKFDSEQSQAAQ